MNQKPIQRDHYIVATLCVVLFLLLNEAAARREN
jgi:hypothetical protein